MLQWIGLTLNSVAQAKTGTGKTIAFLLPLLQRMITDDPSLAARSASRRARSDDIRGIILSPTRELAEQIAKEAKDLVRHTGLVVQSAVGGTQKSAMLRATQRQGCHLLVATPGRLLDLLQDDRSGIDAPNLSALVLDEADRMLDVGFERELQDILKYLPSRAERTRQTLLVSATIPDNVIRLARSMVRADDFEFVQTIAENEALTHEKIPQHVVPLTSWANVYPSLFELIDKEVAQRTEDPNAMPFKAIVYLNTTALTQLSGELGFLRRSDGLLKIPTFAIQSQLTQMQRTKASERFRNARTGILFSSDVTARGMDFPNVTHVIQIDAPRDRESYIHRLGRTGRQNKDGEGWLFLPPQSVGTARRMLKGLPLQLNETLESFNAKKNDFEESKYHTSLSDAHAGVPNDLLSTMYKSIVGSFVGNKKNELVDDLNDWATLGWRWDQPPQVSRMWAQKMGMGRANLNFGDRRGDQSSSSRFDDDDGKDFDRPSSRNSSGSSGDPFKDMSRFVRRDDRQYGGRDNRDNRGRRNSGRRDFGGRGRSDRGGDRGYGASRDEGSSW